MALKVSAASRKRRPTDEQAGRDTKSPALSVPLGGTYGRGETSARAAGALAITAQPQRRPREVLPIHKAARAVLKVRRGWQVMDALAASGIPVATWYQWLKADTEWPDGSAASPEARRFAARLRRSFARAQSLAAGKATESVISASKMKVGDRDWRAASEWLKYGPNRRNWHEHRELKIEHAGQVSHEHKLALQMDRAELVDCIDDPEWRELLDDPGSGRG